MEEIVLQSNSSLDNSCPVFISKRLLKMTLSWDIAPCNLVEVYRRSEKSR
jgi:hypothetical protein